MLFNELRDMLLHGTCLASVADTVATALWAVRVMRHRQRMRPGCVPWILVWTMARIGHGPQARGYNTIRR
jgi:hypothetical protein